jgi:hypothetical protein
MALPTCVKCGQHRFELQEAEPAQSNYKFFYLQCASCGGVAGVTDFYNVGHLVKKQEKELASLRSEVADVRHALQVIANRLSR